MNSNNKIQNIIIVGGGTTGWMAASYLTKTLQGSVNITLIESDRIPTVGVGEATVPSIRTDFFDFLGLSESEWMPECTATFKIGIKYVNWAYPPSVTKNNTFFHIFGEAKECDGVPLTHYWLKKRLNGYERPMAHSCYPSQGLCEQYKSPKFLDGRASVDYAYHFDAGLVAQYLTKWATKQGVVRVVDQVVDVALDDTGAISSLKTEKGNTYTADLYLDCSGFRGLLINEALKEPFLPYSDNLLCDSAVATALSTDDNDNNFRPYTTATALSSGWVWEIPQYGRLGTGYVYSQNFISPEQAEQEFRAFHGIKDKDVPIKHLKMRVGRTKRAWVKNCVSLGLSSGFIEPLESTGIYFIYAALKQLTRYFPDKSMNPALSNKFNERIAYMIDDVRDFIVLHYCTTSREDTPFWKANKFDLKIPESLQNLLDIYRAGAPINTPYTDEFGYNRNFDAGFDRFWTNSNYLAILAGVNYLPDSVLPILNHKLDSIEKAEITFRSVEAITENLLEELPSHYAYIKNLHKGEELMVEQYRQLEPSLTR
ncbi:tryptophan 7-halogenase [Nostoc sp. XA010]|uniref:tryptophan halogenase family protein n=1 Tax=Nostoc sp. XA010 TaxID=2780407 RepID=UPI001E47AB50|nr:tryptophan halogenase family protein [Nostoc sp. XA010]MCC5661235.1 tryptophan 7-halogenase [Nostoc sp. XA010]